jgi:hypothetical protein
VFDGASSRKPVLSVTRLTGMTKGHSVERAGLVKDAPPPRDPARTTGCEIGPRNVGPQEQKIFHDSNAVVVGR